MEEVKLPSPSKKNSKVVKTLLSRNPVILTGGQGTGKTTLAISLVLGYLEQNPGAVFYHHGLDGALFGQHFDDPTKWHELPDNAIIYIDEADKNGFANEKYKSVDTLGNHLRAITELRHKGHYLILSTVSVMDIHYFIRQKTQGWAELFRPLGLKFASANIYQGCRQSGWSIQQQKDFEARMVKEKVYHDRDVQALFKSSSHHSSTYTKANIPWFRLISLAVLLVATIAGFWFAIDFVLPDKPSAPSPSAATASVPPSALPSASSSTPRSKPALRSVVYELTAQERIIYSIPEFVDDEHYQLYTMVEGYTCSYASLAGNSWCRCHDKDGHLLQVKKAVCLGHIRTHEYPLLPPKKQDGAGIG